MEEQARVALDVAPDAPFGCDALAVPEVGVLLACEGATFPGTQVLLAADRVVPLTMSRPGVPATLSGQELTGEGAPELVVTVGGGGTLSATLSRTVFRWADGEAEEIGRFVLSDQPHPGEEGPVTAQVVTGAPLCVAPGVPPTEAYVAPTEARGPGRLWVWSEEAGALVEGGGC